MNTRRVSGDWVQMTAAVRAHWPGLTELDVAAIGGEREELLRRLKACGQKTYREIEREVTEFELRDVRAAYASRPSLGIMNDE